MKNLYALFFTGLLCLTANAQDTTTASTTHPETVEKSIFNAQIGTFGAWGNWEARLGNRFTLRTEIGLDMWFYDTYNDGSGSGLAPSISIESRWYYNIAKHADKGGNTANNGANFLTVGFKFYPDLFLLGDAPGYVYIPNQMSIIPKWGIRRNIGSSNFNYEAGIGLGYLFYFSKDDAYLNNSDVALDLHLRIGYTFK